MLTKQDQEKIDKLFWDFQRAFRRIAGRTARVQWRSGVRGDEARVKVVLNARADIDEINDLYAKMLDLSADLGIDVE